MASSNTLISQYDTAGSQAKAKALAAEALKAVCNTLTTVSTVRGKVNAKVDNTNGEIQKLQLKAAKVSSGNQGKMKKLQRKSKFLMDGLKDLEQLQSQLDAVMDMLQRRKLDYLTLYDIGNRATVVNGELYLRDDADALTMNAINIRRRSEAFDLERTKMLLMELPKELRD